MRRLSVALILIVCGVVGCHWGSSSKQRAAPVAHGPPQVNLLAMGDWGTGDKDQKAVADAMANYVRDSGRHFDAGLLCGDNIYTKLSGVDDPQWQTMFEQMYDP